MQSPRYILCSLARTRSDIIDAGFSKVDNKSTAEIISHLLRKPETKNVHIAYAYLPTLDGVMCTYPGYLWRLLSNSVVFMQQSGTSQWFYDALKPYEHYIPIKQDMSDLVERIEWARKHEAECVQISSNARDFVKKNLMIEDIYLYFYALLQEYITCQDFDKTTLIQDTLNNPLWEKLE